MKILTMLLSYSQQQVDMSLNSFQSFREEKYLGRERPLRAAREVYGGSLIYASLITNVSGFSSGTAVQVL
jgi:hypothetical protein